MPRNANIIVAGILVGLVSVMSGSASHAEDAPIDCDNANSTVEMNFCADKDFAAADKNLNSAYKAALAYVRTRELDPPYDAKHFEEALRASQRAWVAFRDADCRDLVAQEWSGGTGTSSAILGCMIALTKDRTKDLRDRFAEK